MALGIIDYGFCNINSVASTCKEIDNDVEVISDPSKCDSYEKIILPGVGNFESAIEHLQKTNFIDVLIQHVEKGKFLLGICLGMQLLLNNSEESNKGLKGLGVIGGDCIDIGNKIKEDIPVPHMGWSEVSLVNNKSKIINNIEDGDSFYFANSYYCEVSEDQIIGTFNYGSVNFPAIITNNSNVFGVQFHPEKSQKKGIEILRNFINVKE